jgi:hypothetical protein
MDQRHPHRALAAAILLAACSRPAPPAAPASNVPAAPAGGQTPRPTSGPTSTSASAAGSLAASASPAVSAISDKIWKVVKSSAGDSGTYYVFLADGSMLITSAHGKPAIGRWRYSGEVLTLVEEGLPHPATLLQATPDTLAIRIAGPGQPVSITFVPATAP